MPTTPTSETPHATATSAVEEAGFAGGRAEADRPKHPTERARQIAEPLAASLGLELVEVEYLREGRRWVLRLYVDKAGGGTLDDCTALSHALGPALDVEDFPPGQAKGAGGPTYALEVSSPGIERPLRKPADFRRFAGKKAQVKTYAKIAPADGLPGRRNHLVRYGAWPRGWRPSGYRDSTSTHRKRIARILMRMRSVRFAAGMRYT